MDQSWGHSFSLSLYMTLTIAQQFWILTFSQMMQIYKDFNTWKWTWKSTSANKYLIFIKYWKVNFIFHPVQKRIFKMIMLFINNQSLTEDTFSGVYIVSNIGWKGHINYFVEGSKKDEVFSLKFAISIHKTMQRQYYTLLEPFLEYWIIVGVMHISGLCNLYLHYKRKLQDL